MNKNRYRVIFSQARGMFIAVAEIVKSRTKTAGQSIAGTDATEIAFTPTSYKKLNPLNFAVVCVLGAVVYTVPLNSIANTQIIADKSAPRNQQPQILNSANGTVQVNIQTPSAGGVSRNTFKQFDVGQEGAILNNARNNTQTQIGGWVQGNSNLARGEAKVILNEVNSSNPSQLRGYLEVAGKSAQVVIANPAGLVCDGCGVINADRFTLTTGQAVMNQGYLESFRVREGQVTIEGKGLNGSLTPFTDVYTQALKVNAGLYAKELNVVLGQNDIQVKGQATPQYTPKSSAASSNPSGYALDVGKLGGMYAGKIFLVGTEQGLGVRNAGSISSTESTLTLNANGDLINQGNIVVAKDQIELKGQNIENTGNISSTNNKVQLQASNIKNAGLIASLDEIRLDAKGNINNNQGVINAGRLDLTAKNLSNEKGQIEQVGGSKLNITAQSLDNQQGRVGRAVQDSTNGNNGSDNTPVPPAVKDPGKNSSAQDASKVEVIAPTDVQPKTFADGVIQVENHLNNQSGKIHNNNDTTLTIRDKINNTGGELQLPELKFTGQEFENQGGKLSANQIDIQANKVNNQKGQLNASHALDIRSQQLNNQAGSIQSEQALKIQSQQMDNQEGKLVAVKNIDVQTGLLNNQKGVIASTKQNVLIKSGNLDNSAGQISGQQLDINAQQINNQSGSIQSQSKDLNLSATQIDNGLSKETAGNIIAGKNLNLQAQQLQTSGQIYAGDSAQLKVSHLQQHGQLAAQNQIKIQAEQIQSNTNSVWAAGLSSEGKLNNDAAILEITAQDAQIAGKLLTGAQVSVKASNTADLSDSATQAKNIQIETTELKTNRAKLIAEQQLNLKASQSIENEAGQYSAADVQINTKKLNNNKGLIQHTGKEDFVLNIADRIDNDAGQVISNAANTEINTKSLRSVDGAILHAGDQQLKITAQDLQGQQGKIQSNGNLQLELGTANLDGATTSAKNIKLSADSLSHQKGQMLQSAADGTLQVEVTKELNNQEGEISAAGNSSIKAQSLNNQSGKVLSNGQLDISVTDLNNKSGIIYAGEKLNVHAIQAINNQQGLIASQQALNLNAQSLNNQKGQIQSGQSGVTVKVTQSVNNQAGTIQSADTLKLDAAQFDNKTGKLIAGSDATLNVTQLNNQSGTIYAKKQLDLLAKGVTDNNAGLIAAGQVLNLKSKELLNNAGQIRSENADLNLSISQDIQNNTGLVAAAKNLNLTAQNVDSKKGRIQAGGSGKLQVNALDNTEGVIYAADQLQLNATEALNNQKGTIAGEQHVDLQVGTLNNESGQIRSQQEQLTLSVQNDLDNSSGEISAAKNIELKAKNINNQKGKVVAGQSLQVDAEQLDNTEGTLYAKEQQKLTLTEQFNNQSGIVAANQQIKLKAGSLNNNAGKIRSEKNQLDLQIQNKLDNQSGEIFAGTDAKIKAAELNNQHGVVYSKQDLNLQAKQLNNQQGQAFAEGQAQLNVKGSIDNRQGVLAAKQNLDIQSEALDNTDGTLRSENADLKINAQGQLINQQGDIYAGQNLTLNTLGLDNSTGQIAAKNQLNINTQQQQLNNQSGTILAQAVDLNTGLLDNQAGLIQAEQSVKINTNQQILKNNNSGEQGGILSQGSINLNVSQLDNQNGYIASKDTQNITAQSIRNQAGQIISQADLNIQQQQNGGDIQNNAGTIQAQKNLNLSLDHIDNSGFGSQITAGEKLTIHANNVINSQTKDGKTAGGLNAKNLEINAQSLDNQSGVIRANDQAQLNIQTQLNNQAGSISSLNQLSIGTAGKGLDIDNTNGELLAKNQLDIQANQLNNQGKIISEGNVEIDLKQDFIHTKAGQISANGLLKLSTEKNMINQSELKAGQKIILNAQNIDNQTDATISANEMHLLAQNSVHNQGLINGGNLTHIQANHVWNDGARIYGDHVAIQANTLDNKSNLAGTGAVIASRGDMDLGIGTLNNRSGGIVKDNGRDNAWIFSAGNLNIGSSLDSNLKAQGSADKIYNGSAVIESIGDMHLGAQDIQNMNENLVIELVEKNRERVTEYGKDGQMWDSKDIRLGKSRRGLNNAILFVPQVEGGPATQEIGEDWSKYEFTKVQREDEVKSTSPGQIIAGGNLSFSPDANFLNKDSQVFVGQSIKNGVGSITNESTELRSIEQVEDGTSQWHSVGWNKLKTKHKHKWGRKVTYQPSDVVMTQPIQLSEIKEHTLNTSTNPAEKIQQQSIQQKVDEAKTGQQGQRDNQQTQNQQLDVNAGQITSEVDANVKKPEALNSLNVETQTDVEGGKQQNVGKVETTELDQVKNDSSAIHQTDDVTVRTLTQDNIRLPSNALLIVTKDSQAQHLVETDPAFTNYKKWLSSDHMIKALGLDPALQQKRLGDGYYEQRLVQDQVAKLTGRRFLDGYSSDEEQYKALMNNGLSFAKQHHLRPGIALTPEQIAQLTSDIVWLEEKTIILADGSTTKALVPQVYVKARVGDLRGDGTLISGDSIQLDIKDNVINSGTIAGREAVVLNAENIDVLNGRIQANQVGLTTKKDLNLIGGQIHAQDKVVLDVGNNLNLSSSTQSSENKIGESLFTRTGIDRVAGIYTKGPSGVKAFDTENLKTSVSIRVVGDATMKGAEILNQTGHTRIESQGNLNIGAIQTEVNNHGYVDDKNYNQSIRRNDQGSKISGLGSIDLSANKIEGKAVNLQSKSGDILLNAKQGIQFENGNNLHSTDTSSTGKSGSLLSGKTEHSEQWSSSQSISNQIKAGGNIVLNTTQGDIQATHLKAEAGKNIQIQAQQGNVTLNSTINETSQSITSSSTDAIKYKNRQSGFVQQDIAQTELKAGQNVDINAGKNITLQANKVEAGKNIIVGNTMMERQSDGQLKAKDGSTMPENVTLNTLETQNKQWDEQQEGYRGIAKELIKSVSIGATGLGLNKKISVGSSSSERTEKTQQQGNTLTAENIAIGSANNTKITSGNLTAENVHLSGKKVTLDAAKETEKHSISKGEETIQGLGVKLNKDNIRLGGFVTEDTEQTTTTTKTTHKSGEINTKNLSIEGAEGVDLRGQNVKVTGDTVIDHGRGELNIGGYENTTTIEEKTKTETISTEVGVRNAYLDAANALIAVKDAMKALSQAKDAYSKAEKDYAAGRITKQALNDSKANIAMATTNLATAQIAAGAAAAGAAAAGSTSFGTGFTIGANGERIKTESTTKSLETQWQGSNLELNNLTLKSEGQNANIQGSNLRATGTTTFDGTKDLNITAGTERTQQESKTKTENQKITISSGGGGSASIGKQDSQSQSQSLNHVNSQVELNKVSGSLNSLNIKGGSVSIQDRGNLQVNNIHVESLQDTAQSSNSSKGGSIGGGTSGNVTLGVNQSKGNSDSAWVNNQSTLLIGNAQNDADLDAMGVKKVTNIGGVIANASKQTDGTLQDHGKLNFTGELELKDIQDHSNNKQNGFDISTSVGKSTKGLDQNSSKFPNGSTTIGVNRSGQETEQTTKATMGQGSVKHVAESTNRDINATQEITRDQTTEMLDGSVTVDHRLLSKDGRAEIIQEQKDLPENLRQSTENIVKVLPDGEYKDKVLQTLNNVQSKLVTMPEEMKAGGEVLAEAYPEYIRNGGEPKDFEQMMNDPETLQLVKEVNEYTKQKAAVEAELIKQGFSEEQASKVIDRIEEQVTQKNSSVGSVDVGQLETIVVNATKGILLPNGTGQEAMFGTEKIAVDNTTNALLDVVTKAGQIKQKVDKALESSPVNPSHVGMALGLVLGGPANLVKSIVLDSVVGEKIEEVKQPIIRDITAGLQNTDGETIDLILGNKQQIQSSGNETAQQLVDQLQWSKDGVGVITDIVLGAGAGAVGGKIVKGKDSDIGSGNKQNHNSSDSANNSREEFTKPYDPNQTRKDLEAVYGEENVSSTTIPKKPHQASSSRNDVIIDTNGGKAVKVKLSDGTEKMIPYDKRGLAIFDDVVVFTTKIDHTKSYSSQMGQASKDMWEVIKNDPNAKSKFTANQLKDLELGRPKIEGYTWHHNAQSSPNSMQLVPNEFHSNKAVPHSGQNSLKEGK